MEGFFTLPQKIIAEQTIDKSRFIGIGVPVQTIEEINSAMIAIQQDFPNARHYVYAYRLHDGTIEKASDDGEPQGTGGRPVLDFLQHQNVWNVLLVVVRYFGGVLLGTGGLTRAYGSTARQVLSEVELVKLTLFRQYRLCVPYEWYELLKYQFKQRCWSIRNEEFSETIDLTISIPKIQAELFLKWIEDFTRKQVKCEDNGTAWG
ncbi:IMPACT family protein [Desulfosporosinus sp. SB140]|uniref:IMPACT family protein n=1 Tax=Desulfosporosinus paludis TaxID=3115649 RepID=UPI00388E4C91